MSDTKSIYQRMAEVTKEVKAIGKNKVNSQQHFNFRGIDDVMAELHDLFANKEIIVTHEVLDVTREERPSKSGGVLIYSIIHFRFQFTTTDGSSMSTEMIGEGMDSGDKASNKAVSIALKYALINTFLIPTSEGTSNDPDASSPQIAGTKPTVTTGNVHQYAQHKNEINSGKCEKCGAPLALSKAGNHYCSAKCWLKEGGNQ